jgi:hypothetical protein
MLNIAPGALVKYIQKENKRIKLMLEGYHFTLNAQVPRKYFYINMLN